MGSPELEIAQPRPRTYLEYVGGLDYGDDDMGGDELPPATCDMDLGDVPMPSVQVEGGLFECLRFSNRFSDLFWCRYGCIYASFDARVDYWHYR
jgi:hypothetical protein